MKCVQDEIEVNYFCDRCCDYTTKVYVCINDPHPYPDACDRCGDPVDEDKIEEAVEKDRDRNDALAEDAALFRLRYRE